MGLVKYNPDYRRTWMFPRNIRRIHPWKIAQICAVFKQISQERTWSGNQALQDAICKALESCGLKTQGEQYDLKSGGPRTYFAQLKCLGLIFQREDKRRIWFTKAGDDLINGKPPLLIMQTLLLKHQYPSVYGNLRNVKMHPEIKVKPFLFVLEILLEKSVGYLTYEELIIPIIYGHNEDSLEICVKKILQFRKTGVFADVICDKDKDLYTPRTKGRRFEKSLEDFKEIANTCKNYLQACCLITVEDNAGIKQIQVNVDMLQTIEKAIKSKNRYIKVAAQEESFQRALGSWDSKKDTRNLSQTYLKQKASKGELIIIAKFIEYCGENAVIDYPNEFIENMEKDYGLDESVTRKTIQPLLINTLSYYESTFLEMSKGGTSTATKFEKAVCILFNNRLHFKAEHTGQRKRTEGVGGYADVFIVALDNKHCAIIDTKASPAYTITSDDYAKMISNYIVNYKELCNKQDLDLEFCLYVAGGLQKERVKTKLKEIKKETRVSASAINAFELLQLSMKNIPKNQQSKVRSVFKKTKVVCNSDF